MLGTPIPLSTYNNNLAVGYVHARETTASTQWIWQESCFYVVMDAGDGALHDLRPAKDVETTVHCTGN